MERDAEDYIMQLEKRIVLLEGRVAMLEARLAGVTPKPSIPDWYPEIPYKPIVYDPNICPVCRIEMKGAWSYTCAHPKCPNNATC